MLRMGMGLWQDSRRPGWDADALAFFTRAAVTDPVVMLRHNRMVKTLKSKGLWDSLAIWYGADAGALNSISPVTPATNGQTVRKWINRKGDSIHVEQSTGTAMPLYQSGTGLNGSPAIVPDGVDDCLLATLPAAIPSPFTMCVAGVRMGQIGAGFGGYRSMVNAFSGPRLVDYSAAHATYLAGQDANDYFTGVNNPTGNNLIAGVFNGTNSKSYHYGKALPSSAGSVVANSLNNTLRLFQGTGGPATYYGGGFYSHIFIFSKEITDAEFLIMQTMLHVNYGGLP